MSSKPPLRSPQFSKRLVEACDQHVGCPALHKGRLTWLKDQLEQRGLPVTVESIRRWLAGEGRPTQEKCAILAEVLGVDPVHLYMGRKSLTFNQDNHSYGDIDSAKGLVARSFSMSLRPDITVEVNGLPYDLTASEANRLASVIRAIAEGQ